MYGQLLCLLLCGPLISSRKPDALTRDIRTATRKILSVATGILTLPFTHASNSSLKISAGCPLDSELGFYLLTSSFTFIETPFIKCLTAGTTKHIASSNKSQQTPHLVLSEQEAY